MELQLYLEIAIILQYHIIIDLSTGKWTVPMITGEFPPLTMFSINTLPGNGRAIVFGGASLAYGKIVRLKDVFFLTYSAINNTLVITKKSEELGFFGILCGMHTVGSTSSSLSGVDRASIKELSPAHVTCCSSVNSCK